MAARQVSGIYEIVNLVNGKRYVGSAVDIVSRWYGHRHGLRHGTHHSNSLMRAWTKYGAEAFVFRVIEHCDRACLLEREQAALDRLRPAYNVSKIAGRPSYAPDAIERSAANRRGRKVGPLPDWHKAKISAATKGRKLTAEHAIAISAGKTGKLRPDMKGNRFGSIERSAEHCRNMSVALKGRPKSAETKARMKAAWAKRRDRPKPLA